MGFKKKLMPGIAFVFAFGILAGIVLTATGRLYWFVRVRNATVQANGKNAPGYLHKSELGPTYYLTRSMPSGARKSYRIGPVLPGRRTTAFTCTTWVAPDLPVFVVSVYTPPCWAVELTHAEEGSTKPALDVSTTASSLRFRDSDGEVISVVWP